MDVWILTNAPSSYQVELLAAAARVPDLRVHVRYMRNGSGDATRRPVALGSTIHVMRGVGPGSWRDEVRLHPEAVRECTVGRHDCYVLSGLWTSLTFLVCAAMLWLRRRPWIVWLERPHPESTPYEASSTGGPLGFVRDRVRRLVLTRASAVMCIGTAARQAYSRLDVPEERLFIVPYCCDTRRFRTVDDESVAVIRRRYDLGGKVVLLFSGQMIARKGVDTLLWAFDRIAYMRREVALVLLGDGPLRKQYEAMVPARLRSRVHFAGRVSQDDLPAYFAAADLFVFPSRHDGWGVVINEACAAGLPIVATRQTGAVHDLVEDGRSGFLIDADDADRLSDRVLQLIDDREMRNMFGERSRQLGERLSADNGATLLAEHVRNVVTARNASRPRVADVTSVR